MLHIGDLDIDHDLKEISRTIGDLQIADVAALLADRGGQAAEIARLVGDRYVDPAGMGGIRLLAAPGDVEPALGLFGEAFQRVAIDRVDRHALAGRDDADDPVTRQRMAAAGKMHRHPWDKTPDRHRRLGRAPLAPRPGERDDLVAVLSIARKGGVDHLAAGGDSFADRNVEILDRGAIELLQYRFKRPLGKILAVLAERLLHDRAAEI